MKKYWYFCSWQTQEDGLGVKSMGNKIFNTDSEPRDAYNEALQLVTGEVLIRKFVLTSFNRV